MARAVCCFLAFVVSITIRLQPVAAQVTQADLRDYTESAATRREVSLSKLTLTWKPTHLIYVFSDTLPVDWSDVGDVRAASLEVPISEQFRVTSLRLRRKNERGFWKPILMRVEEKISDMLNLINSGDLKREKLHAALYKKSGEINYIFSQEFTKLARRHGRKEAITETQHAYRILSLFTKPSGGVIRYMPAGRFNLYRFMRYQKKRLDFPKPDWITLRQTRDVTLYGKNWFHIRWPDGATQQELVRIGNSASITFTPSGN